MTYCRICILPDTRPGITLGQDLVCSACRGHALKTSGIDWSQRGKDFETLVTEAKERSTGYDCIVPVSGGKDSWFQVITCKEMGLKVLGLTWRAPGRTPLGQRNLDQMIARTGIDHIDYSINPAVESRFMRAAFEEKGASALPMHMALFHIPIRLAVSLKIPLIVWGENPQLEYGGEIDEQLSTELDEAWLRKHGCLQSTTPDDWTGEVLSEQDLVAYQVPSTIDLDFVPRSIFLGSFLPWDPFRNTEIAQAHGFEAAEKPLVGSWNFADIDDEFMSIHHFLKWYKFGITRAFDNLSVQIRFGKLTRGEAIETLRRLGPQVPQEDIQAFVSFVEQDEDWFWKVCETFRNPTVWHQDDDGRWTIPGFIIDSWQWS